VDEAYNPPMPAGSTLTIPVPDDFVLFKAVCSYGYFLLAPNRWDRQTGRFHRVFRAPGRRGRLIRVTMAQTVQRPDRLRLACDRAVTPADAQAIKQQTNRMLRIDEDQSAWYRVNRKAKRRGFGRMFRSADLWEDMVKTITGCNVTWRNTMTMNARLVECVGHGGWPTPASVVDFGEERLKAQCRVGYRAERIVRLAEGFLDRSIDAAWYESPQRTTDELYDAVTGLYGFGEYATNNVLQLLGRYDRLPIDTETYRHYCATQGVKRPTDPTKLHARIERYYAKYDPYRFKAYWFELWGNYEQRFGPAKGWCPDETGPNFTAATLNKE